MIFTNEELEQMRKIIESILNTNELMKYTIRDDKFNIDTVDVVEFVKDWITNYKLDNNIDVMTKDDFINISKDCINDFNIKTIISNE